MEEEVHLHDLRWRLGIFVEPENCPKPALTFEEILTEPYLSYIRGLGFSRPTPVQMQALPILLSGMDLIGLSATGTGKTLAYLLPVILLYSSFRSKLRPRAPSVLIVCPTRELVNQIVHAFGSLAKAFMINEGDPSKLAVAAGFYGGVPSSSQLSQLDDSCVVVCTPGRILDLCERHCVSLAGVRYLVLDECDRLLGRNFEEQLKKINDHVRNNSNPVQSSLWSATVTAELLDYAKNTLRAPVTLQVGVENFVCRNVDQEVIFIQNIHKPKRLLKILRRIPCPPVLIFCNRIDSVVHVAQLLRLEQFHVAVLHSDLPQGLRDKVMDTFRRGRVDVLVCTDIAARGLDFPDVDHVIQYELPADINDYVHRCGRTARVGRRGRCVSFLTLDCRIATELKELLELTHSSVPEALHNCSAFGQAVTTEFGDLIPHRKLTKY